MLVSFLISGVPTTAGLSRSGVKVIGKGKERAGDPTITAALAAYKQEREESGDGTAGREPFPPPPLVPTGPGLAAVSKKLVNKIIANEYIDFNELPPAKGKGRSVSQAFEGQLVVVQAADLRKLSLTWPRGYNVLVW